MCRSLTFRQSKRPLRKRCLLPGVPRRGTRSPPGEDPPPPQAPVPGSGPRCTASRDPQTTGHGEQNRRGKAGGCAGKAIFSLGTGTGTGTGLAGQARGPAALCWLPPRPGLAPGGLRAPRTPSDPRWAPVGLEEPLSLCRGSLWPR